MSNNNKEIPIRITKMRPTVEVHLPDGRVMSGPRHASIGDFLLSLPEANNPPIVGAIINGELRELTYKIDMDARTRPVTMGEADGMRIYRRSLVFLLETAFDELYPNATLTVDHSVSSGGYYCEVDGHSPLIQEELDQIDNQMRKLVEADITFTREEVPLTEAIERFIKKGKEDKVRLLKHRKKDYLTIYRLKDNWDYHHGYMVPSTGFLQWFKLLVTEDGFTLCFPRRHRPTELLPLPQYPKLLTTFRQYKKWLDRLGIASVGALNDSIQDKRINEIILVSEALHEQRVTEIAAEIASRNNEIRLVLIAGPSSSGKTTFSKRLSVQLLAHGITPFTLEMDNYFKNREDTPKNEEGDLDFESINALDRQKLSEDLRKLIKGELVQLPKFNFKLGIREPGLEVQLKSDEIIIMEGIHGLNPDLIGDFPSQKTYRIFASALTQLNLDRHNRVSTTDTRLLRRIVRDARDRGYSASETIQRWESVRRGEKRYIFPYQENADVMFNSALVYELSALKSLAEPLLRQVIFGTPEYVEAKRLLAFLEWFLPVESDMIPDNSILREFIGGSTLKDFTLWHNTYKK